MEKQAVMLSEERLKLLRRLMAIWGAVTVRQGRLEKRLG